MSFLDKAKEAVSEAVSDAKEALDKAGDFVEEKVAEGRKARGAGQKPGGRLGRRGGEGERIGEPLAGGIVSGSLEELNRNLVPLREVTREAAAAAASGALQGADGQRAAIARMVADATGAAGQAFARAMAEEMRAQIERGLGGGTQLPDVAGVESAASQIARRAAAAAVGGATDQLAVAGRSRGSEHNRRGQAFRSSSDAVALAPQAVRRADSPNAARLDPHNLLGKLVCASVSGPPANDRPLINPIKIEYSHGC